MPDAGTIDRTLRRGAALLDDATLEEIRTRIVLQQTTSGGFPDRAGNGDLYYTLFGFFLASALEVDSVSSGIREYVQRTAQQPGIGGTELYCLAILCAGFFPGDRETKRLKKKIRKIQSDPVVMQQGYSRFLVLLSLLYLRDYTGARRAMRSSGRGNAVTPTATPCPVLAAELILEYVKSGIPGIKLWRKLKSYFVNIAGREKEQTGHVAWGRRNLRDKPWRTISGEMSHEKSGRVFSGRISRKNNFQESSQLMDFYRGRGGFAALTNAPESDLLSTSVALFALQFTNWDLRMIRPDCLEYISSLFAGGGFRACEQDEVVDMEYTFYGLLGLGALEKTQN
jgi:hypothetical protein